MEVMVEEKAAIVRHGKRYRDAADEMNVHYPIFIKIINGLQGEPVDFRRKLNKVLRKWNSEKN